MELVRVGNISSMGKPRKVLTSAGAYLVKKNEDGSYDTFIIHEKWPDGKETYMLPKGRKQPKESLEETAVREITEETGYCDFKLLKYIGSRTYELDWDEIYIKTDHYYLALLETEKKVEQNQEQYEKDIRIDSSWVSIDGAFNTLTYDGERPEEFKKLILDFINEIN